MRTVLFLVGGVLLWVAISYVASSLGIQQKNRWLTPTIFGAIWFMVAAWNMWVGVKSAGYSFWVELPIFLLIFLGPLGLALFSTHKFC